MTFSDSKVHILIFFFFTTKWLVLTWLWSESSFVSRPLRAVKRGNSLSCLRDIFLTNVELYLMHVSILSKSACFKFKSSLFRCILTKHLLPINGKTFYVHDLKRKRQNQFGLFFVVPAICQVKSKVSWYVIISLSYCSQYDKGRSVLYGIAR